MNKSFVGHAEEMNFIYNSFHNSTLLQMCRQMINTHLLNNGIEFCKGGCKKSAMSMEAEVEEMVDEKWMPFCSEAIDSILCFGFCVVSYEGNFPSVLKQGTYRIKCEVTRNEYVWQVLSVDEADSEIPNCEVFNHFGLEPRVDGRLTSPVAKILPRLMFLKRLREACIDMEMRRADPFVYSEIKENNSSQRQEGVDYDFYADAGATETRDEMQFSRNKSAVEMLDRQKELYEQYMGRRAARKAANQLNNVVQLPMGQHVVNPQMTTGRTDLVNLHKLIQEEVCAVIGVPRSMMFADSGGVHRSDDEGIHNSFMHTLLWYKKKLGVMLSDIYNKIYTSKIMKEVDFSKEKNAYEAKKKYKVEVFFPVTPFVPNEQLRKLYEEGVISWDAYATYALRNVSLPLEDKMKGPPPVDELLFEKPKPKETPGLGGGKAPRGMSKGEDAVNPKDEPKTVEKKEPKVTGKGKRKNESKDNKDKKKVKS